MGDRPETIIIFGAPGSGKDTQAEILEERLGYQIISTGKLARMLAGHNKEVKKIMNGGKLIPDTLIEDELVSAFTLLPEKQPVILNGYPRTIDQVNKLEKILQQNNRTLDKAIFIKINEVEAIKRLSKRRMCKNCNIFGAVDKEKCDFCGGEMIQRNDDKPEAIKKRFKIFYDSMDPILDHYRGQRLLFEIDGNGTIEEVRDEIKKVL